MEESPVAAPAPRGAVQTSRAFLVMLARENLLLALGMGAITLVAQVMEELPAEPLSPLIVALVFYAVYSLDRAADADADGLTHPERARFSRRNARRMRAASLAAYALAVALAATRGVWAVAVALLPLAALLLYSFRIVPRGMARRAGFSRIKEVFVLKNVWVAATLAGTATLLPIATAGAAPRGPAAAAMGGFLFGRWWINTLVFDLRDVAGDRANGLRTVPVVLGRARTCRWEKTSAPGPDLRGRRGRHAKKIAVRGPGVQRGGLRAGCFASRSHAAPGRPDWERSGWRALCHINYRRKLRAHSRERHGAALPQNTLDGSEPMRKLTLKIDELQVESFTTARSSVNRGTVRGHGETDLRTCACPSEMCTWGGCPGGTFDCNDPSLPDCGSENSCEMNNCGTLIEY